MPEFNDLPKFLFYQLRPRHAQKMALAVNLNAGPDSPLVIEPHLDAQFEKGEKVDAQLWAFVTAAVPPYSSVLVNKHTGLVVYAPHDDQLVIQGSFEKLFKTEADRGRITWNFLDGMRFSNPDEKYPEQFGQIELDGSRRMCLDVKDKHTEAGSVVQAWGKMLWYEDDQHWTIDRVFVPVSKPVELAVHA